jgi:hypothetical protein
VHNWRDSFDTAKQRICLEVKELSFTWKYDDNVDFLNVQLRMVVKDVYVVSQLAPTSVNAVLKLPFRYSMRLEEPLLIITYAYLSILEITQFCCHALQLRIPCLS